ncbi:hypothetical protein [Nocardioides convexus]|uniref:hypothetical protein n=1 Tax=Nocardioides convexus TaxID=2712224 RepID=UPI0024183AC8|nr:hypothetical protein [Nocardioides convexus]
MHYTEREHDMWRTVCGDLTVRHRADAATEYLESAEEPGDPPRARAPGCVR